MDPSARNLAAHAWLEVDGRPLESIGRYLVFQDQVLDAEHGPGEIGQGIET